MDALEIDIGTTTVSAIVADADTGQMHGIVYLDGQGRHISPLFTWQGQRGELPEFNGKNICEMISEAYGVRTCTGYGLVTHLLNVKKIWFRTMQRGSVRSWIISVCV